MKTRDRIFVFIIAGFMLFSALAFSLVVILSGSSEEEEPVSYLTSVTPTANFTPEGDVTELGITDITAGIGDEVKLSDTLVVHYTGWLAEGGTVFDSSVAREPAVFALQAVILGWQEGLVGIKEGGVRRLVIPSELGYGVNGNPPQIPGNADLVFEVQVLEIVD